MHRLRRLFRPLIRRPDSEHGAIAALLAILLSGGVLIGMGAVVIDVGSLYLEREELQSGADAASWGVAVRCVSKSSDCTTGTQTPIAVAYAKKNAKDKAADAMLCFNNTGCPSNWSGGAPCPALAAPAAGFSAGNYVEVRTSTVTSSNGKLLPPAFAQALTNGSYSGQTLGACGRVNWGPPAVEKVFALGISQCDWKRATNNGQQYYGLLANVLGTIGLATTLGLTAPKPGDDIAIPQAGGLGLLGVPIPYCTQPAPLGDKSSPRGYTWLYNADLSPPDANCMITPKIGDYNRGFLLGGLIIGTYCEPKLRALIGKGPILVPIFDAVKEELITLAPQYHIVGFAPFVVTGYSTLASLLTGVGTFLSSGLLFNLLNDVLCVTGSCVYGYFTKAIVPVDKPVFGSGKDFGSTVIGRTG